MKPAFKYDPHNVDEDYYEAIRGARVESHRIQVGGRWFEHDYQNPPKMEEMMPGDVFLFHSQFSSSGTENLPLLVFMGGNNKSFQVLGHKIPMFRYKMVGTSRMMEGIVLMKIIYAEVWP